ncbi:ATP-binding protein [Hoylesella timonensis]|uniref:AAA family ATPase n=2 Tax=Hoylesella timonensis TaxID=386414 RepID=UPI00336AD20C
MEENPFAFGKAVEGGFFTDRLEDTKRLQANLTHGINTVLISPRRWGKTSLVKKVMAAEENNPKIKMVLIDVFACKSEYEFCKLMATEIIKQTSSKIEEWVEMGKTFLSNITPKFSFGSDPLNDFAISFEWNPKEGTETDILRLPEKIAEKKGVRIVICLDEFQQIAEFKDSMSFQKKLRTIWQHQQNVTYCMFGSKRHLMMGIFADASCPFYKFADMMFLRKIPKEEWTSFICHHFEITGKSINPKQAERICDMTDCISSYVQHLSWIVWYKANTVVTDEMVEQAFDELLDQNKVFFQRDVESLTGLQKNFLVALADGITTGLTTKDVIWKYRLESSANVQAVKKSMSSKEFIDIVDSETSFNDPIFRAWIKRNVPLV